MVEYIANKIQKNHQKLFETVRPYIPTTAQSVRSTTAGSTGCVSCSSWNKPFTGKPTRKLRLTEGKRTTSPSALNVAFHPYAATAAATLHLLRPWRVLCIVGLSDANHLKARSSTHTGSQLKWLVSCPKLRHQGNLWQGFVGLAHG